MAKKGTYAAYQRLTPIEQDFGDDLVRAEQLGFAYRREAERKKAAIDEENKKFIDEFSATSSALTPFDTKVRNVNEVVGSVQHDFGINCNTRDSWCRPSRIRYYKSIISYCGSTLCVYDTQTAISRYVN